MVVQSAGHAAAQTDFKFDFGTGKVVTSYTKVTPVAKYTKDSGYGFDLGSKVISINRGSDDALRGDFVTGTKPFFFSVTVPEGSYNVTVILGDTVGESSTTVKAESRRLMLENVKTGRGQFETRTFTVNVRTPKISTGGAVKLKEREREVLHWDDKLTLEFNGSRPCVAGLEIKRVEDATTVFLIGDSTVTDQPREPWNSWGQMLTRFFKSGVAVANHAESGESIRSSLGAHRLEKVYAEMKKGDYVFAQFGHNDMKSREPNALATYKSDLKQIVANVRQRGGTPVLVTSMERKAGVERDTLAGYPNAVREVAKEDGAALIDLHATSKVLYKALGKNLGQAFQDGTHHNNYGSYELAKCIVEGIKANKLGLVRFIADDVATFDPAHPDAVESFTVPASPMESTVKPDGN
jgi:lysophospholipase L1-like esterase